MRTALINKKTGYIIAIGNYKNTENKDLIVKEIKKEFPQDKLKNEIYFSFKENEYKLKTPEMIFQDKKEIAKRQLNEKIITNLYQFFIDENEFKNKIKNIINIIDNATNQDELNKALECF